MRQLPPLGLSRCYQDKSMQLLIPLLFLIVGCADKAAYPGRVRGKLQASACPAASRADLQRDIRCTAA